MKIGMNTIKLGIVLVGAILLIAPSLFAAEHDDPPRHDLEIRIDAGAISAPAFLGSKNYQLSAVPNISVKYKDKFFASLQDGVGYNIINNNGWRLGPLAKYAFERNADGDNPFLIAGRKTHALHGLGTVDGTLELGGFAEYTWMELCFEVELRQGVNGHKGMVSDLNATYTKDIHSFFYDEGPPMIVSFGPHATLVNSNYDEAYFGVTASQSAGSGLPRYTAGGGLLSYGVGMSVILPLSENISTTWTAGYDRVAGAAGDSPLVRQHGCEGQRTVGAFVSYSFGIDGL